MAKLLRDQTANTLQTVIKERQLQPRYGNTNYIDPPLSTNLKSYVVVLPAPLAAATNNMDGTWILTEADAAAVYERPDPLNTYSPNPDEVVGTNILQAALDIDGTTPILRRVWNFSTTALSANTPYPAFQDVYGDLYVIVPGSGTPTTPTGIYYVAGTNNDLAPVPPYGVLWNSGAVVILGVNYLSASRPFDTFDTSWYINREIGVLIGDIGVCDTLLEKPGPVLIDPSLIGTINVGNQLGPAPNSYSIWPGRPGFTAIGSDYTIAGLPVVDCIQRQVTRVFGRLYQALTQNADGTGNAEFEIWHRGLDEKRYPAGWNTKLTVYAPLMNKNEVAKQGTFGFADKGTISTNEWEGDFACDPDDTNTSQSGYTPSQQTQMSGQAPTNSTGSSSGGTGTGTGTSSSPA